MDKSFNDDELSDIMKEIEALEQNFTEDEVKTVTPVLEELAEMREEVAIPTAQVNSQTNIVAFEKSEAPKSVSARSTSMSFKVEGELTLDLKFEIGGKNVQLEITPTGLQIEMEGGVKFTVPIHDAGPIKKAV